MKNKLLKNKSVTMKWFVSYFLLLIIPLFVSLGVYIKIEQTVKTEIEHSNQLVLSQIKTELDNLFSAQERICTELAFDSDINELLNAKTTEEQWQLKQKIFSNVRALVMPGESYVDDIYVYFIDQDIAIMPNSITDGKTFYQMRFDWGEDGYENWRAFVSERRNDQYALMPRLETNTGEGREITFFRNLPITARPYAETKVVIASVFWESRLINIAEQLKTVNGGEMIILDENNEVFYTSSEKAAEKLDPEMLNQSKGDTFHSAMESSVNSWKYVISVKKQDYWGQLSVIRISIVLYVIFTLLVGGMMSKIFVKQNYAPIMRMMNKLKIKGERSKHDEFSVIFDGISKIIEERDRANIEVKDKNNCLRNYFFSRLLSGKFKDRDDAEKSGRDFSVTFPSDLFAVVLFYIEDGEKLFADEEDLNAERKREYYQIIMINIMEELLGSQYHCYVFEMGGLIATLISIFPEERKTALDDICRTVKEGVSLVEKYFSVSLGAVISNQRKSFEKIGESYYEAYDTVQTLKNEKIYEVVKCSDVCSKTPWYNQIEKEIHLSNYIKAGDSEKAIAILRETAKQNRDGVRSRTELVRCIMFNLLNIIRQSAEETSIDVNFPWTEYGEQFFTATEVHNIPASYIEKRSENMEFFKA